MGNPARVVSYEGSFDLITYDGMESDPDRIASLRQRIVNGVDRAPETNGVVHRIEGDSQIRSV